LRLSTSQALRSGPRELIAKPNHSKLPLVPKQYSVSVKHNTEGSTPPTIDEALISHFIETVCPSPSECLRVWVRFLAERSRQSPMLWNALSALSYLSHARNDPSDSLLFQSQRRYTATIRLLRGELAMVNGHNAPGALDTMTLLSIYEVQTHCPRIQRLLSVTDEIVSKSALLAPPHRWCSNVFTTTRIFNVYWAGIATQFRYLPSPGGKSECISFVRLLWFNVPQ
jgi:hypothetical protein